MPYQTHPSLSTEIKRNITVRKHYLHKHSEKYTTLNLTQRLCTMEFLFIANYIEHTSFRMCKANASSFTDIKNDPKIHGILLIQSTHISDLLHACMNLYINIFHLHKMPSPR